MRIDLKQLDKNHPLRNTPLIDIGAHYKMPESKVWSEIRSSYGIAKKTFNQLADCWMHDDWVATKYDEDWQSEERDRTVGQNGNIGYD